MLVRAVATMPQEASVWDDADTAAPDPLLERLMDTAARQMVVHGHVIVNGIRVDRPSFHVSPGSLVTIKEKSKAKPFLADIVGGTAGRTRPSWIDFDPATMTGKLISSPDRSDLPFELNENAIIEYYSQQL